MAIIQLRRWITLAITLVLFTGACGGSQAVKGPGLELKQLPRQGLDVVLVVMPLSESTHGVWTVLQEELGEDFDLVAKIVDRESTAKDVGAALKETKAACMVLMDNRSVRLYENYQREAPEGTEFPPALILLTSFLDEARLADVENSMGIAYEVPAVTAAANMRSYLTFPTDRVGVLYRSRMEDFVVRQTALAQSERVRIVARQISDDAGPSEVRGAIEHLVQKERVDALWILNDNVLLSKRLVQQAWLPAINSAEIPVIVGLKALVSSDTPFGTFAMVPDHTAMAVQAADAVFEMMDAGDAEPIVYPPTSTKVAVDVKTAKNKFGLRPESLANIDYLVE